MPPRAAGSAVAPALDSPSSAVPRSPDATRTGLPRSFPAPSSPRGSPSGPPPRTPSRGLTLYSKSRNPNSRDGICAPRARYHPRARKGRQRESTAHIVVHSIFKGWRIQLHTKPHEVEMTRPSHSAENTSASRRRFLFEGLCMCTRNREMRIQLHTRPHGERCMLLLAIFCLCQRSHTIANWTSDRVLLKSKRNVAWKS